MATQPVGLPGKTRYVPIPSPFFTTVLPLIEDLAELKVTLHLYWLMALKRSYPRFVTKRELLGDIDLMSGLALEGNDPAQELERGLSLVIKRDTFLQLTLEKDGEPEHLLFLNTPSDKTAMGKVESGEIPLGALPRPRPAQPVERRSVFELYEANIGALTPLIADELKEAEKTYPWAWIEDAFKEAVRLNHRSWGYIERILERWSTEGRGYGKSGRSTEEAEIKPGQDGPRRGGYFTKRRV